MDKLGIFPPYLKEKLELINVFGVKKYLLFLLVTILECAVIFIILYGLIFLCTNKPMCGMILVSILLVLGARIRENMIIKRKTYSEQSPQATSAELQAEQMRLQREQLKIQKQREKIKSDEMRKRLQMSQDAQRQMAEDSQEEAKNQIKVKKLEEANNKPENVGLYKSRSKVVTPIPMRG